jgi:hypothetical protein
MKNSEDPNAPQLTLSSLDLGLISYLNKAMAEKSMLNLLLQGNK